MGEKEVLPSVTFKTGVTEDLVFNQIPVQRNYRTNIFGSLFTNTADYNVTIDPTYKEDDYLVTPWDGKTMKEVTPVGDVYSISSAEELAWIANQVNAKNNRFTDKTVKLMEDINMNNKEFAPIGSLAQGRDFSGVFDGNGKTIFNLNIVGTDEYGTG